ncbi:MAG: DUF4153 domain-containing protein, partial [Cyclobacteriaceae bacterium]
FQAIIVALIGLTLTLTVALVAESLKLKWGVNYVLQAVAVALCIGYYMTLPAEFTVYSGVQVAALTLAFHLLVAVAAFLLRNKGSFWDFNKATFISILTAVAYTGTLTVGLELALLAVNELFGADLDGRIYPQLFVFMAGIFNTLMFLSGLPHPNRVPEGYPRGLRLFTQYVLVPLTVIYFIILYAYIGKIIIEWEWPKGWVSIMIIGYSVVGMLSYLLVYPLRDDKTLPWIRIFSRWFYISLLPLSVLLYLAVYVRVADYGLTMPRLTGIIIAVWLAGVGLYFVLSENKDIRIIPATLAALILLFSFGPWGLYHVSLNSQYNRLTEYLQEYDRLEAPYANRANITDDDAKEMRRLILYILNMEGKELLRPYHTSLPDSVWDMYSYNLDDRIAANWRIQKPSSSVGSDNNVVNYTLSSEERLTLEKPIRFTNMIHFSRQYYREEGNEKVIIRYNDKTLATIARDTLLLQLPDPEVKQAYPASEMIYRHIRPGGDTVNIWFRQMSWTEKDGEFLRLGDYHGSAWW